MENQKRAYIYATIVVLFWSTSASVLKITLRYLNVVQFLLFSSLASTIVFFICLLISQKLSILRTFTKKDYLHSAILGFLNPFLYYIVLIKAYSILPAQQAQPINFAWPVTLVLLSIFILKQKIKFKDMLAIIISFTGVLIISTHGNFKGLRFTNPLGVSLALGSTIIWALFWIYNMKDKADEAVRLFLNFVFGTFYIFLLAIILTDGRTINPKGLPGAVYIGLFEMGITFLLWLKALKLSETTAHIAHLIFLVPFISLIVIHFAVGEKILISTVAGLLLIVGGIILQRL